MQEKKYLSADQITAVSCPIEEQETTIQISRDGTKARIWSSDNTAITRFKKCLKNSSEWVCWEGSKNKNGNITGYFFECPKKFISYRSKIICSRQLTEEERFIKAERLRNYKKAKNNVCAILES